MPTSNADPLGRGPKLVLLLFAVSLLLFTKSEPIAWADASRLGSIQALVEFGTLALDDTDFVFQGDKIRTGGRLSEGGHYYSHQPPMLAMLGAAPYAVLHAVGRSISDPGTYEVITLSVVGLPLLLGFFCLALLMRIAGAAPNQVTWLLAAAAFGTLAFPYALVLNQHGPAAGLAMAALLATQHRRFAAAGALLGLASTVDLTAAFFAIAMLLPIARAGGVEAILRYGLAAVPTLALHFAVNYAIIGDLLPLGLHAEAFEYAGSPFVLMNLTGGPHDAVTGTFGAYAFGALLGKSGLFSHHPVLLFALVLGALSLFEGRPSPQSAQGGRAVAAGGSRLAPSLDHALLLASAGICAYYLTQSRNFGGSAFGMRWFCVFAPTLMLLPAAWLGRDPGRRLAPWLFVPLLVWSVCGAALGAAQPWTKLSYRWQSTPYGKAALGRDETVPLLDHAITQLNRATRAHTKFDEQRWQRDFLTLMNSHRQTYLLPRSEESDQAQRARMESGLVKLDRVIELFEEEADTSISRAWAHYWRAQFYRRLGRLPEAEQELGVVIQLSPDFYQSPFFDRGRERQTER